MFASSFCALTCIIIDMLLFFSFDQHYKTNNFFRGPWHKIVQTIWNKSKSTQCHFQLTYFPRRVSFYIGGDVGSCGGGAGSAAAATAA